MTNQKWELVKTLAQQSCALTELCATLAERIIPEADRCIDFGELIVSARTLSGAIANLDRTKDQSVC